MSRKSKRKDIPQAPIPEANRQRTVDAFQNVLARMGMGTPSMLEGTDYPLTRLTRNYQLMNSLYRSHWVVRRIIDVVPEDMMKNWYQVSSQLEPKLSDRIKKLERRASIRAKIMEGMKWGRLYGGAAAIMMIAGQENMLAEPLNLDLVMPGSFKGLLVADRWSGISPGPEVVTDISSPEFGLPSSYLVTDTTTGIDIEVHYSRVLRFTGRDLPYWEKLAEVYWGASEIEHVFDELKKRDNTSWNIANLVFRANLIVMGMEGMEELLAIGNEKSQQELYNTVQNQNWLMNNFSMYITGNKDTFDTKQYTFSGLADVYESFMMDVAGAAEIPVTKLFGRSPAGLNATGESDMQNYYDMIESLQESKLRPLLDKLLPVLFMSELGAVPDDLDYRFNPVRRPTDTEKSDLGGKITTAIVEVFNTGLISQQIALKELRQSEEMTGMWSNIKDEDIEAADRKLPNMGEDVPDLSGFLNGQEEKAGGRPDFKQPAVDALHTADSDFEEGDHPRDKDGKFASGGAGSSGKSEMKPLKPGGKAPAHIQALKIPPAWTDVRYNPDPEGDLLATGIDSKGRKQYVYSEKFASTQAEAKFRRIQELDSKMHYISKQNEEGQKSKDPRVKDSADCMALIFATGIRPGSESDTKAKVKAYGATTLEGKHVVVDGDKVSLQYVGKKGVSLNIPVEDPKVAAMLKGRAKKAGKNGKLFASTNDKTLLAYTHGFDGGGFKTKDFRTLLATRTALEEVEKHDPPKDEKSYKKAVKTIAKTVAAKLGNTPTVALQSYINPAVFAEWRDSFGQQTA